MVLESNMSYIQKLYALILGCVCIHREMSKLRFIFRNDKSKISLPVNDFGPSKPHEKLLLATVIASYQCRNLSHFDEWHCVPPDERQSVYNAM